MNEPKFLYFKNQEGTFNYIQNCDCKICNNDCVVLLYLSQFIDPNWLWEFRGSTRIHFASKYILKILFSKGIKNSIFNELNSKNFDEIHDARDSFARLKRAGRRKIIFRNLNIIFEKRKNFDMLIYEKIYTMIAGDFLFF